MFLFSENKGNNYIEQIDFNYTKEIYFNKESFLTARDEIFNDLNKSRKKCLCIEATSVHLEREHRLCLWKAVNYFY